MRIKLKQDKEAILKILKSSDVERKLRVLEKLNGVNEKDSIKILVKTLEDRSWCMREKAAHKLATYGKRVTSRLTRLLKKGYWYTRASACLALGEIGDIHSADAIISVLLEDENPTVQQEASAALVKIAHKKPRKFAAILAATGLEESELHTVLFSLERVDIDLYQNIKEQMVDEREV
jgi:HEAT repeat protein